MKTITNDFKTELKANGREIDVKITYTINGTNYELGVEELNAVEPHYEGGILKSVMKQLDIDSNTDIPLGTILECQFGLKVNGSYEYISYGNYIVYSSEKQEDLNSYKITCYDKILYSMKDYETPKVNNVAITYPITIRDYINAICSHLGLTFKNANDTFTNYDKTIASELYLDGSGNSMGYTFRDILDELAQVTASTICINEEDDELEVRYITETNDTIDEEFFDEDNVNFGELYGPINTITFKRSADADVISVSYPENLPDDEKIEIAISDNQILNGNNRDEYIDNILNKLLGLSYYINDYSSKGILYYNLCDKYTATIFGQSYSCVMLNDDVTIESGLKENVFTEMPNESVTDYTKADKTDRRINQTYLIVDKQNQTIESVVSQSNETTAQVTRLTQRVGQLESEISDVADLTVSGESSYATLELDNINESEPITITIKPITDSISYLYPRSNLYPSSTTYLKNRKIRFHNETTNENFDYEIPDDLLYYDSENYDEFELDYNEQTCIVTKKCKYNADGSIGLLTSSTTNTYTYPTINLTEGDYTISLLGYSSGYLFVRLMSKNIYTSQFYTKAETNSLINQTSQSIDLSVNSKLTNYSTTNEMNSAINLKANEITSSVNNTLTNYSTTTQMNSAINQKADEITSSVTEEVSENYETKTDATSKLNSANSYTDSKSSTLSSRISQTAKSIALSVNNGSTSSGITITTTKENGDTTTASGTIEMTGLVKFTDLSTSGSTTINGSNITTGTISTNVLSSNVITTSNFSSQNINASKITTGTLNGNNVTIKNLNASNITAGTLNGRAIKNGSISDATYQFKGGVEHIKINDSGDGMIEGYYSSNGTMNSSTRRYAIASFNAGGRFQTFDSSGDMAAYFSQRGASDVISDKRDKQNIENIDIEKSLNIIKDLNPVTFNYKKELDDDKIVHRGLIAQEVEQTLKNNGIENQVYEINENGRYLLNYIELIPDLINCIKYLSAKIEKLERESDK